MSEVDVKVKGMRDLPIYWRIMVLSFQARMQYKATFLFTLVALIFYYLSQLSIVFIMTTKFEGINGWALEEVMFLYGLLVFSQSLATFFFASLSNFEEMVVEGEFDRLLIRPLNPLGQMLSSSFELTSVAHLIIGVVALCYGSIHAGVEWTLAKVAFFPLMIAGAVLIHGGIRLAVSAIAFWTLRNRSLFNTLVVSSKEFILYPISIYNLWLQVFLTILFPLAFINYYPSHYFLAKDTGGMLFHPALQYGTPVVGCVVFFLAYKLWRAGVNRYQSVGN